MKEKATVLFNITILFVISIILLVFMKYYSSYREDLIKKNILEHTRIVAGPLWNFDNEVIDGFLSAVIVRKDYAKIQVYDVGGDLFSEAVGLPHEGIESVLKDIGFVQYSEFSSDIKKGNSVIGKLVVIWRDTTRYVALYASIVALMIFVNIILYSRNIRARNALGEKIEDLRRAMEEVRKQKEYIEHIFNVVPQGLITFNDQGDVIEWNASFDTLVKKWVEQIETQTEKDLQERFLKRLGNELQNSLDGEFVISIEDRSISFEYSSSEVQGFTAIDKVVSLRDVTDITAIHRRLAQAEKLQSVGRLASGIAHEINTPAQYVVSNVDFLSDAYKDLAEVMERFNKFAGEIDQATLHNSFSEVAQAIDHADWAFLEKEIPGALDQSREGLRRIQTIVGAMKQFSHPAGDIAKECDLNAAIESTVTVSRNEWKYVADLELDLDPNLPTIPCFLDHFNQALLVMIINSVHAIEEKRDEFDEGRGRIVIRTFSDSDVVHIIITDTGIGMSSEVRARIFDPFFTTKELNKGTGQGLAIAHDIVVNKHGGSISVESTLMEGTTFSIQLPVEKVDSESESIDDV